MIPVDALTRLKSARSIAVLTGAGVSAESGVATFRDPDGIWARFSPAELASMDGFMANPQRVLDWYAHRRAVVDAVEPNAGHTALVALERWITQREGTFTLITQNVDRLHQRAGSRNVLEVHGNLVEDRCSVCEEIHKGEQQLDAAGLPVCTMCGGRLRPNVVWFGEDLPRDVWDAAERAAHDADVFMSIGTSSVVWPAAGLAHTARSRGAVIIEVNPTSTDLTPDVTWHIAAPSGTALPLIVAALEAA